VAAFLLLLQPVQAQAPVPPAPGGAAAADAAEIQRQAAEAMAKAVNAAARCDREELARQLALLESLNARIAEVRANAAAGMKAARRVPEGFGGPPQGGADSIAQAESAVRQLLGHARNLVPACGPEPTGSTASAPPAEDIPTLVAEPAPPGFGARDKNAEIYFPAPTPDNPNPTGTIRAPYPPTPNERLLRTQGSKPVPAPTSDSQTESDTPEKTEPASNAEPPKKT